MLTYTIAVLLALGSGISFAINDVTVKLKIENVNSVSLSFLSLLFGFPIILISFAIPIKFSLTFAALIYYIIAGIVNFTIGRSSLYASISRLSSSGGSILSSTSALFGFLVGWLGLNEKVTLGMGVGVLLIMISVYLTTGGFKGKLSLSGIGFGLIAGLCVAISVALAKLGDESGGQPVLGVLIAYLSGTIFAYPGFRRNPIKVSQIKKLFIPFIILGTFAAAGQIMRYIALLVAEAATVAPLQNIRPIASTMLLLFLGAEGEKKPKLNHWIGAILASVGAILVSIRII